MSIYKLGRLRNIILCHNGAEIYRVSQNTGYPHNVFISVILKPLFNFFSQYHILLYKKIKRSDQSSLKVPRWLRYFIFCFGEEFSISINSRWQLFLKLVFIFFDLFNLPASWIILFYFYLTQTCTKSNLSEIDIVC